MTNKNIEGKPNYLIITIFAVIIVLSMWLINYYQLKDLADTDRGTFGDMFGSVNAIYSGLAFAGIIITIYIQSYELRLQRKELELTREEMQLTREEFSSQNDTMRIQRFENTFFQMLNLFHSIVDTIEVREDRQTLLNGRKAFNYFNSIFSNKLHWRCNKEDFRKKHNIRNGDEPNNYAEKDDLIKVYNDIYEEYNDILGHYFRTFYHIIKLIDTTNDIDKKFYISIARSQISNSEQVILFYNCLHSNGEDKFKPLVEKYSLFNNIDLSSIQGENSPQLYDIKAYG